MQSESASTKTCKICGHNLPLSREYFADYFYSPDRLSDECRPCRNKIRKELLKDRKKKKAPEFLTVQEKATLLKYIEDKGAEHEVLVFHIMGLGGLRISEVLQLTQNNINKGRNELLFISEKSSLERVVPLPDKLRKLLYEYLLKQDKQIEDRGGRLFEKNRFYYSRKIRKYGRRALGKSRMKNHTFRHSFAFEYLSNGGELHQLQKLLGHISFSSTMIYAHVHSDQLHESVDKVFNKRNWWQKLFNIKRKVKETSVILRNKEDRKLIGREEELKQLSGLLDKKKSVIVYGEKGIGKTKLIEEVKESVVINTLSNKPKKMLLLDLILDEKGISEPAERKKFYNSEEFRDMRNVFQLFQGFTKILIFDDITQFSKDKKQLILDLSKVTRIIACTSREEDVSFLCEYQENRVLKLEPLKKSLQREIIYQMCFNPDDLQRKQDAVDIMNMCNGNLKEAENKVLGLTLGQDIHTEAGRSRDKSVFSVLYLYCLILFYFGIYFFKSYLGDEVAKGSALFISFLFIIRLMFFVIRKKESA